MPWTSYSIYTSTIIKTTAPDVKLFTTEDNIPDVLPRILLHLLAFSIMFSRIDFPKGVLLLFIKTDISALHCTFCPVIYTSDVTKVTLLFYRFYRLHCPLYSYIPTQAFLKDSKVSVKFTSNKWIRHTIRKIPYCSFSTFTALSDSSFLLNILYTLILQYHLISIS